MAAEKIVFNYEEMVNAANAIAEIAQEYQTLANNFAQKFEEAVSDWEGDSKISMMNFINDPVYNYIGKNIPELVAALAELLNANAQQMMEADSQIAESLPKTL